MLVTLAGMVTLVRPLQLMKAYMPMLVTLFGMVTLVRLVHSQKALAPILVTPSSTTMLVMASGYLYHGTLLAGSVLELIGK